MRAGPFFAPYNSPAGGWGALHAVAKALREQSIVLKGSRSPLSINQPDGFDCPDCAWPDPRHTSSFEFCENGAKAVAFELTKRRVTREFFATHSVSELEQQSDYWLEEQGRLTEPMRYDPVTDHYVPIDWSDAFALIARELNALRDPNEAEFYTSGRTSNEAAFMYQLFARRFGTNNFPDCSNMCHEPTSVGLPESIEIGKGTVVLDDFAHAEAIFIVGQNPGTNSPRMMTELHNASRRGVPIVVFNPLRERALERFAAPQNPVEMVTFGETRIASEYCQVRVGGDVAALKGVAKLVLEAHDRSIGERAEPILDLDFIAQHTHGLDAFAEDIRRTAWEAQSEFTFTDLEGTLVGLWSPGFSSAFSVPGYHFHFLSADRQHGGHLLDVAADVLRLQVEALTDFHLALPELEAFLKADLSKDTTEQLAYAEKAH